MKTISIFQIVDCHENLHNVFQLCLDCEVQTRDIEDFVNKSAEVDESLDNLLNWANVKYGDLVKLEDVKPEELSKLLKVSLNDYHTVRARLFVLFLGHFELGF